jgi:hypothetical protein
MPSELDILAADSGVGNHVVEAAKHVIGARDVADSGVGNHVVDVIGARDVAANHVVGTDSGVCNHVIGARDVAADSRGCNHVIHGI